MPLKEKNEIFQHNMKILHPKYDFSKFVYKTANIKGTFICPEHGPKKMRPDCLRKGRGCRACGGRCPTHTKEQFFIKMKIKHPNYDFSKFVYKKTNVNGTYICPEHGEREANPRHLLDGGGCSACAGKCPIYAKKRFFIEMKTTHPTLDFSKFIHKNVKTKGTFICPVHGPKKAMPDNLLTGSGCDQCNQMPRVQQQKIYDALKNEFPFLTFDWEKRFSFMEKMEFDISCVIDNKLIAIEYDGEQHFRPVNFGGRSNKRASIAFNTIKKLDRKKNRLATHHNVELIRIPYYEWKDNPEEVLCELFDTIEDYL